MEMLFFWIMLAAAIVTSNFLKFEDEAILLCAFRKSGAAP